jgi:hypothetical protein
VCLFFMLIGLNGFVMSCPEVVVYLFVCGMVDVYVEGVGQCCSFKEIACDQQHDDQEDEEEQRYFFHNTLIEGGQPAFAEATTKLDL